MVMIVQTYALAMPILYLAGLICFMASYWAFKILFLR